MGVVGMRSFQKTENYKLTTENFFVTLRLNKLTQK